MSKILLIDDDRLVAKSLKRFLEAHDNTVITAENGLIAKHLLEDITFDLIITDILMPREDGIQVIMHARHNKKLPTPILAISGGGLEDPKLYLESAQSLGANEVLRKPFTNEQLLSAIKRLV